MQRSREPISETVKRILKEASKADDLSAEFEVSLLERYKRNLVNFKQQYGIGQLAHLRTFLTGVQLVLGAIGTAMGFFLIQSKIGNEIKFTVWIAYVIIFVLVGLVIKFIPENIHHFHLEDAKLRLLNLSERFAAELILFDLIEREQIRTTVADDKGIIRKISDCVPSLESLDEQMQSKIRLCQDSSKVFENPRETNVRIKNLKLNPEVAARLQDATHQIVELCGHIFAGRDYTAKIYLRSIDNFNGAEIEILVSFAKYPSSAQDPYGSSWVKVRGNPSIVWECLERGLPVCKPAPDFDSYYASVLAICLPGRIGVLALTSSQEEAFKDKDDEWTLRALAVATRVLVLKSLQIEVV
jgi:hypothetical protein